MNRELKKAIMLYMIENDNTFSLVNYTIKHFREYIYNSKGEYLIGWKTVSQFIEDFYKLLHD